jgi:hypothetical protein
MTRYELPRTAAVPKAVAPYLDVFGVPRSLQRLTLHDHLWSKTPNIQQWGAAWSRGLIVNLPDPQFDLLWTGRGLFCQSTDPSLATALVAGLVQDVLRLPSTYEYTQGVYHQHLLRWYRAEDYHYRSRSSYHGDDKIDMGFLMTVPLVVVANVSGTDRYQCDSVTQLVSNRKSEGLPTLVTGVDISTTMESSATLARLLATCCVVTSPGDKSVVPFALTPVHAG